MIRILLVDDHEILLDGLEFMLNQEADFKVIGKAKDGIEAIESFRRLRPDITCLDISMPKMDGREAAKAILKMDPLAKIVVLTFHDSFKMVTDMIEIGVLGYVVKSAAGKELVSAIRTVNGGESFYSREAAKIVLDSHRKLTGNEMLTQREAEVLSALAGGRTSKEIADHLNISSSTVESHKKNLLSKLGLRNSVELVRYAIENGYTLDSHMQ